MRIVEVQRTNAWPPDAETRHPWCPQGDSNPCRGLERAVSWASRRWGRATRDGLRLALFLFRTLALDHFDLGLGRRRHFFDRLLLDGDDAHEHGVWVAQELELVA